MCTDSLLIVLQLQKRVYACHSPLSKVPQSSKSTQQYHQHIFLVFRVHFRMKLSIFTTNFKEDTIKKKLQ